jgi:hypothetical protein
MLQVLVLPRAIKMLHVLVLPHAIKMQEKRLRPFVEAARKNDFPVD